MHHHVVDIYSTMVPQSRREDNDFIG